MSIFQKSLGWVQRYLYNVENGTLPFPVLALDIAQDWPLNVRVVLDSFTTAVGASTRNFYVPGNENHGLFYSLMATAAGVFPVTDTWQLSVENINGQSYVPIRYAGLPVASDNVILIGGKMYFPVAGNQVQFSGCDPIYVPPGANLRLVNNSLAGGIATTLKGVVLERPKYYPLRLP